jgi:hypothetical protein
MTKIDPLRFLFLGLVLFGVLWLLHALGMAVARF